MSLFRNDTIPVDLSNAKKPIEAREQAYIWEERIINVLGLWKIKTGLLKKVYTTNEKMDNLIERKRRN